MDIKQVRRLILAEELLIPEYGISIVDARRIEAAGLINLYENALVRGDWFGSTCYTTHLRHVASDFVHKMCTDSRTLFFAFVEASGAVLGAAALRAGDAGFLLDEAQVDPLRGRKKGVMSAYSRRIIPVLSLFGRYWTEFLLTPGSRVMRKVLITELGMVPTGLKTDYYLSRTTGNRFSVLVAYGPRRTVNALLDGAPIESVGELLDIVRERPCRDASSAAHHDSPDYRETTITWGDVRKFHELRMLGFLPVECNPFLRTTTLAKFPVERLRSLQFLAHEGIATAARLHEYCSRQPLEGGYLLQATGR